MIMKLDFASSAPIYQQIRDQIVQAVADGDYLDGQAAHHPRPCRGGGN